MKGTLSTLSGIIALFLSAAPLFGAEPDYLTYDKFILEVESGSVKGVTLDRFSSITGTYLSNDEERPFRTYGDTGSANDVLLIRFLNEKKIPTTLKEQKEHSPFWRGGFFAILMFFIPVITFILVLRINFRVNRMATAVEKSTGQPTTDT